MRGCRKSNVTMSKRIISKIKETPNKLITMVEKTRLISREKGLDAQVFIKPPKYVKINLVGWGQKDYIIDKFAGSLYNDNKFYIHDVYPVHSNKYLILEYKVLDDEFTELELDILGANKYSLTVPCTPGILNWFHSTFFNTTIKKFKEYQKYSLKKHMECSTKINEECIPVKIHNYTYMVSECPQFQSEFKMYGGFLFEKDMETVSSCIQIFNKLNKSITHEVRLYFGNGNEAMWDRFGFIMEIED